MISLMDEIYRVHRECFTHMLMVTPLGKTGKRTANVFHKGKRTADVFHKKGKRTADVFHKGKRTAMYFTREKGQLCRRGE